MNGLSNVGKVIVIGVVAAILIIVTIVYGTVDRSPSGAASTSTGGSTGTMLSAESSMQNPTSTTSSTPSVIDTGGKTSDIHLSAPVLQPQTSGPVIHIITPATSAIWIIGDQNVISWDKAGNITGSLSLIDATTQEFVGVILPQVGPNQTSYTWNTRNLALSRSNPLEKDVVPGVYRIRLNYDGNNIRPATSPAFTITN